ncbi:MAG: NADH-quinone oxidoreductase subunit NuoF [Bacteroidales bacterium]|nr:NADH-quinone oxidoreductase subunit NuoF [Bacteroidales bacterium]
MIAEKRISLARIEKINADSIDDSLKAGAYNGLKKALTMNPEEMIEKFEKSGLRGRGGAGFPTGLKQKFTRSSCLDCEKYIICNADEGEPGTFKDRVIMERDPHMLIEGMIIAAYVIGASRGFIYIRGEYQRSIEVLQKAIEDSNKNGFLGENVLGSGFNFNLELRLGAGSYLCGEELTLLESLEGKRGYPRIKPPFPAQKGLWESPTLINNVETFSHLPAILNEGLDWYTSLGTEESKGTKIFTITGRVQKPGFYEMEMGCTLRELLFDIAGGMKDGYEFKGALLGGAAGTFVDESFLDIPLAYETLKARGATLGSGAILVLDQETDMPSLLHNLMDFFKHESCGKCVPCRVGTTMLTEMAAKLKNEPELIHKMTKEAHYMAETSLCPLGQSPILPLKSYREYYS